MLDVKPRDKILWLDGIAGTTVGVAALLLFNWLYPLYQLPRHILIVIIAANMVYGCYGLFVASRKKRSLPLIVGLAAANLTWMFVSIGLLIAYGHQASVFGWLHIAGEGAFVAVLAVLEWRWRFELLSA